MLLWKLTKAGEIPAPSTLTSRARAVVLLASVPAVNCQDLEQEGVPIPGPQFPFLKSSPASREQQEEERMFLRGKGSPLPTALPTPCWQPPRHGHLPASSPTQGLLRASQDSCSRLPRKGGKWQRRGQEEERTERKVVSRGAEAAARRPQLCQGQGVPVARCAG